MNLPLVRYSTSDLRTRLCARQQLSDNEGNWLARGGEFVSHNRLKSMCSTHRFEKHRGGLAVNKNDLLQHVIGPGRVHAWPFKDWYPTASLVGPPVHASRSHGLVIVHCAPASRCYRLARPYSRNSLNTDLYLPPFRSDTVCLPGHGSPSEVYKYELEVTESQHRHLPIPLLLIHSAALKKASEA